MDLKGEEKPTGIISLDELREINRYLTKWESYPVKDIINHLTRLKGVSISRSELKQTHIHKTLQVFLKMKINTADKRNIKSLATVIRNSWKKQLHTANENEGEEDNNDGDEDGMRKMSSPVKEKKLLNVLPDLNDPNRNHALKRFNELLSDLAVKTKA